MQHFEDASKKIHQTILKRYDLYEQSLQGGLGFFKSSNFVSREEWNTYADNLNIKENLPGITGIGFVENVYSQNLDAFLDKAREDGFPSFKNKPNTTFNDKFVIKYITPEKENANAIGLDIGFEENRRNAAERARDTGKPALTKKIQLVQDNIQRAGFLVLLPYYEGKDTPKTISERQKRILGWVYAPFIGHYFLDDLNGDKENIEFNVYGSDIVNEETLIYNGIKNLKENDLYKTTEQVTLSGQAWTIHYQASNDFIHYRNPLFSLLIAITGSILSFIIYFFMSSQLQQKEKIMRLVDEKTREVLEGKKFQDLILSNIPDYIFVKDEDFKIIEANDAFLSLYPQNMQEKIIGYTGIESHNEEEAEAFLEMDRKAFAEGYSETEESIVFPNNEQRLLFTKKVRFEDNNGKRFILGIAHDITEIKKAEEAILNSNVELERFAYVASHDLQEPLRMVANFTDLLKLKYKDQIDEEGQEYIRYANEGAHRMRELIVSLLEYAKITNSSDAPERVNLNQTIQTVIQNLEDSIAAADVNILYDELPVVSFNGIKALSLFQNLVGNAIKYRKPDTPLKINIKVEQKGEDWLFAIHDNSIGMKQDYCKKIFEPFKRLHNKKDYAGTGMGLAICRKIVEDFGGKIWVESELGTGSTFYFTIPYKSQK